MSRTPPKLTFQRNVSILDLSAKVSLVYCMLTVNLAEIFAYKNLRHDLCGDIFDYDDMGSDSGANAKRAPYVYYFTATRNVSAMSVERKFCSIMVRRRQFLYVSITSSHLWNSFCTNLVFPSLDVKMLISKVWLINGENKGCVMVQVPSHGEMMR